ncbi:hypothetical protein SAMN04489724_0890 [Algoriphagus locisalis]|uniref:Uncharacterized protein n=1 Tax=Algoriphagus locisalis TaxID=305507 RepID=A0A1I6Y9K6_9BACT|nr:hypothetical protein [Algoriphagus locisalis]SFT47158.1 hypothetical protein SAMN04489724_0890 [Algoriphagus locisalis]
MYEESPFSLDRNPVRRCTQVAVKRGFSVKQKSPEFLRDFKRNGIALERGATFPMYRDKHSNQLNY